MPGDASAAPTPALGTTVADLLDECPGDAYTEAQRLSGMLSAVAPEKRAAVLELVERLCGLLAKN